MTCAATLESMLTEPEHTALIDDEPDPTRFAPILAENVKRMRVQAKINKKRFALMVRIGRPLLNRIENGTADVRLSVITKMADSLATTPDFLLVKHTDEQIRAEVARCHSVERAASTFHARPY